MIYKSTRGKSPEQSFSEVLLGGLAPDGGLYMPSYFPKLSVKEINAMENLSYSELATKILYPFVGDEIEENQFKVIVEDAYKAFHNPHVLNLFELEKNRWALELFHGPTLAFKDIAMQLLGALLDFFAKKNSQKIAVLGATSGDTGAAAMAACARYSNVDVFILYPHGKVTEIQRKQMTTYKENNIHALAVETDFDGCQSMVKKMFLEADELKDSYRLMAANSINWTRCMAQSVYFFWAYLQLRSISPQLIFSIPSGNFGHAYAGWLAKNMGLPIEKLLIAVNRNKVLDNLFSNNFYTQDKVFQTLAPSMDISVASNFERLLYNIYNDDPDLTRDIMEAFPESSIQIPEDQFSNIKDFFMSLSSDDLEITEQIKETFENTGYLLDPHTATGVRAANILSNKTELVVTMATAHPAKFQEAITKSLPELKTVYPPQISNIYNSKESYKILNNNYSEVKSYIFSKLI